MSAPVGDPAIDDGAFAAALADTTPGFVDVGNGITLCYETFGDPADPTILLIMGLGGQMIEWHRDLCEMLVDQGFQVVRFDNRDSGLSAYLDEPVDVMEVLRAVAAGESSEVPYLLADMAEDTVGLLDHLGVQQAHVVGISLGGMIAQELAIRHPERVATLVPIMSRSGDVDVGMPSGAALGALLEPPAQSRERAIARGVANSKLWGSEGVREDLIAAVQSAKWDRAHDPTGAPRQLAAILASGSRREGLSRLAVPTLVIHGDRDQLIQPDGGEQLAELVPGAELLMVERMGHDLAPWLWPTLVEAVTAHARAHPVPPD